MAAINRSISIASGGTLSPVIEALELAPAVSILIMAPAVLAETVKVQVSPTPTGTYCDLQTNGTDVVLAAGKATQITVVSGAYWRLQAGGAVAAQRDFNILVNRILAGGLP